MLNDVSPGLSDYDTFGGSPSYPVAFRECLDTHTSASGGTHLPDVGFGEFGAVVAFSLVPPTPVAHVIHIFLLSTDAQMGWKAAGRGIARMEDQRSVRNFPDVEGVRDPVRAPVPVDFVFSVPVSIDSTRPQPALVPFGRWPSHSILELLLESARESSSVIGVAGLLPSPVVRSTPPSSPCEFFASINTARSLFLLRWGHAKTIPEKEI